MKRVQWVAWLPAALVSGVPSPQTLQSGVSTVVDNYPLGSADAASTSGVLILHGNLPLSTATGACEALGESLWSGSPNQTRSIQQILKTLQYRDPKATMYWIAPDGETSRSINIQGDIVKVADDAVLPAICIHTAPFSNETTQDTSEKWQVKVKANNEDLIGYRDRNSFRFLGVRYAPQPIPLSYPTAYRGSGESLLALELGPLCIQGDLGEEDCLFLNIWTPYLPQPSSSTKSLKPVMFYIYGGGYLTGSGGDPTFDGGNLASRGDVVVVTFNYRLGALGFLALDDGVTNGNFGFADQILALDWVREHIQSFGGDLERITVFGQSAGAASLRAMMVSPKAVGKFAGAISLSYLGGLGLGATLGKYYTIEEAIDFASNTALEATNCTNAPSQVECLRQFPARDIWWASTEARFLVVDGEYLTSNEPPFPHEPVPVHLMMGTLAQDGLPLLSFPPDITEQNRSWLTAQGLPDPPSSLFPLADIANKTLATYQMVARLATDAMFRCLGQAGLKIGLETGSFGREVFYYEFERTYQSPEWPGLDLCEAPRTASGPNGDPDSPDNNLNCHTGEMLYVFGNVARRGLPFRDHNDVLFERYVLDTFSSFARTYNPNPDLEFLKARGYQSTLDILEKAGPWKAATKEDMRIRILDLPGEGDMMQGFRDVEQCEWMGLPLDYFSPRTSVGDGNGSVV